MTKLLIKLQNPNSQGAVWTHLCYVSDDLFSEYSKKKEEKGSCWVNSLISRWCEQDFKTPMPCVSVNDFEIVKEAVRQHSKEDYPELFIDGKTDRQGWMRVWFTKHLKEELNIGKASV